MRNSEWGMWNSEWGTRNGRGRARNGQNQRTEDSMAYGVSGRGFCRTGDGGKKAKNNIILAIIKI